MKTFTVLNAAVLAFGLAVTAAGAEGLAVGQDPDALTKTRISNSGGGAGGNPHWGSEPYQSPIHGEDNPVEGRNNGESFRWNEADQYTGYAYWGEQGAWDADPGNAGNQEHGGNAANSN